MKKLKRLSRENLKKVEGGLQYSDFCSPGKGDVCAQYGLECGIFIHVQNGHNIGSNWACM